MTDILIQFHAVVDELAAFLRSVTQEFTVQLTAFRFFPFRVTLVDNDLIDVTVRDPAVGEVVLTIGPPSLPVQNQLDFQDQNPSALHLNIGRLSERGLDESCLSARTTDDRALEIWRKVARRLRKITRAGVVAINPDTGATGRSRNHRYTVGAKALDDKGVVIRPVAGGVILHLGDR